MRSFKTMVAATAVSLVVLMPTLSLAQTGSGTIAGIVKDATGGTLPGVTVKVLNEDTGISVETLTNEAGLYRVAALVPGRYRVEIELVGFEPVVQRTSLEVSQTLAIDVTLTLGRQSEAVVVKATAPLLESQSSNVAQTVSREMLAALPLPNRAASSLAALAPGVVMIDAGAGTAENYPVFTVGRRPPPQSDLHSRWRQRHQRRRPHASAAAPQPAGRCDAGVQGDHQQLLGGVRPLDRRRRDHVDAIGKQRVSRQHLSSRSGTTRSMRATTSPRRSRRSA